MPPDCCLIRTEFLSTPSARRATQNIMLRAEQIWISIHALREEGDQTDTTLAMTLANFYPRPPRGGRPQWASTSSKTGGFLSTPSARRATVPCGQVSSCLFISIHALREEGDLLRLDQTIDQQAISIHALREEGDKMLVCEGKPNEYFYPRPPRGGRHFQLLAFCQSTLISIHALREEGDLSRGGRKQGMADFYPRPPRGGRRCDRRFRSKNCWNFYPRPPRGGRPGMHRVVLFIK